MFAIDSKAHVSLVCIGSSSVCLVSVLMVMCVFDPQFPAQTDTEE